MMTVNKYIKEKWAKKRLDEYSFFSGWHEAIKEIICEVWKDAKSDIDIIVKWKKIEDYLPEPNKDVLVLGHAKDMSVRQYNSTREIWEPGGWGIGWITHWMELPDLPKERG